MKKTKTAPEIVAVHVEREQVKQAFEAMKGSLDAISERAEAALEKLRARVAAGNPRLRLVKK